MKRILVAVLVILAIVVAASPVLAASVYRQTTAPTDMKEPLVVTQLTDPAIPNPLWPGTTLSWAFRVENISPRDYWVSAYIGIDTVEGNIWVAPKGMLEGTGPGGPFRRESYGEPFLLPAKMVYTITLTTQIQDSSPIAKGVTFTPIIDRIESPAPGGKG